MLAAADAGATGAGDDEPTTAGAEATDPVASDDAEEPATAEAEATDAVASDGDEEEKKPA